jgi:ABC-2 type transport system ATP-binding protein
MHAPTAIAVHNLSKCYGRVKAIDQIAFTIAAGEVIGFLGPNGAGKSTTLRILGGILRATSGSAYICGKSVAADPAATKRLIGYMPENNPLPEDVMVKEYLMHRAVLKEIPKHQIKKSVEKVLETCDLARTASKKLIGRLSKGFRQRVGIADAILGEPPVVLMDEPTIGLDPHQILSIRELIQNLKGSMTILISSHILQEVEASCERVIIINHGHIVAIGSVPDLRKQFIPIYTYTIVANLSFEDFKASILSIDATAQLLHACAPEQTLEYTTFNFQSNLENFGELWLLNMRSKPTINIREIVCKEPNLEEIFIAATKRSWKIDTNLSSQ